MNGTSAAARTAWETAERLWESTQAEPPARAAAGASLFVLYRECIRACAAELQRVPPTTALAMVPGELLDERPPPEALPSSKVLAARLNAQRMLELVELPQRLLEASRVAAIRKGGALGVTALLVCGVATAIFMHVFAPKDLAIGHPWKTSSKYADCHPETNDCGGIKTAVFFYTNEEDNPWLEFDLETPTQFSSMTIENRKDAALNRTMPLIIEVSDDEKTWREVARHEEEFSTWRPHFPTQTARYVRLRIPKRTYFHLEAARIHR